MTDPLHETPVAAANAGSGPSDSHGRAAMLLVESLLHGLVARSLITTADVIEIVTTAVDVEQELAEEATHVATGTPTTQTLLDSLLASFSHDLPRTPA